MAIDRGDAHIGDAETWERACRHMILFLWWAVERGLASEDHEAEAVRADPTQHFIDQCDTKLSDEDLTDDGNAFAEAAYESYADEVGAYAKALSVGVYEIPEGDATTKHFFTWLDARLASFRAATNGE